MRLHPRTLPVEKAGSDLSGLVVDWVKRHDLTYTEALRCLLAEAMRMSKLVLRNQRHPGDPERKADEE